MNELQDGKKYVSFIYLLFLYLHKKVLKHGAVNVITVISVI